MLSKNPPPAQNQHTDHSILSDLVVVEFGDGPLGLLPGRVHDEAVAAIEAAVLHHEPELVDAARPLQHRDQLVLEAVARYLAHEHLARPIRRRLVRPVRRRPVLALPILLHDRAAGARLQLVQSCLVADLLCLGYGGLVLLLLER